MPFVLTLVRVGLVLGALSAATLAMLAYFGFAVPDFDLLNHAQVFLFPGTLIGLLIVILALRGRWRLAVGGFVGLGLLASSSVMTPELLAALATRPGPGEQKVITMMTHNLFGVNYDMDQVSAAILGENADIIVFQEYSGEQAHELHSRLVSHYPYFVRCRGGKRANLALYSKIPFEQMDEGACPANAYGSTRTGHILARFTLTGGKPFSVLTTHVDWPVPAKRQNEQLVALTQVVESTEGPLVLAGDFNSTPWSYALRNFETGAGLKRETASLVTYPMRWNAFGTWWDTVPFLPLDHVMTRGGIVVHDVRTGARTASDHLPVVVTFTVE